MSIRRRANSPAASFAERSSQPHLSGDRRVCSPTSRCAAFRPKDAEELTAILRELAASGTAVVVTGHEVAALLHAAHHVSWCTSGTTYELGPPEVAARHDQFRREYLGSWSTL